MHLVPDRLRQGLGQIPDTQVLPSSLLIPNIEAEAIAAPRPVPAPGRALAHMTANAAKVPVFALEAVVSLTGSAQSLADPMIATQEGITAGMIGAIAVLTVDMTMAAMNMTISAALPRVLVRLSRRGGTRKRTTNSMCGEMDNCSQARKCIITSHCFPCLFVVFDESGMFPSLARLLRYEMMDMKRLYDFTMIDVFRTRA